MQKHFFQGLLFLFFCGPTLQAKETECPHFLNGKGLQISESLVSPTQVSSDHPRKHYLTFDLAVQVIQHLNQNNIKLNVRSISSDKTPETTNLIFKVLGRRQTGVAFYSMTKFLGFKWNELLSAAGLELRQTLKQGIGLTEEEAILVLKHLNKHNVPLNTSNIRKDTSAQTSTLIQEILGRTQTGRAFYDMTRAQGFKWRDLLNKANLDTKKIALTGNGLTFEETTQVISYLYRYNIPLNGQALKKNTSSEVAQLIAEILGRKMTASTFYTRTQTLGYKWKDLLEAAHLNPRNIVKKDFNLTLDEAIRVLKHLYKNKVALHVQSISNDRTEATTELINDILKSKLTGSSFYAMTKKYFTQSWKELLIQANLNPRQILKNNFGLSENQAIEALKLLNSNGIPINANGLKQNQNDITSILIQKATGRWQTGASFYSQLRANNYSLKDLIEKAGIDTNTISFQHTIDDKTIIEVIKLLKSKDVVLHAKFISRNFDDTTTSAIASLVGYKMSGAVFFEMTQDKGLSWTKLLAEAGVPLEKIVPMGYRLSFDECAEVIKVLYQNGVEVNYKSLDRNLDELTANLIEMQTGWKQTGYAFMRMIKRQGFNWNDLLKAAELDPHKIVKSGFGLPKEEAIEIIKRLYDHGIKLNTRSIKYNYEREVAELISQVTGRRQTGAAFYQMSQKKGYSWSHLLSEAGLDITEIQLSGRIPYQLVNEVTKSSLRDIQSNFEAVLGHVGQWGKEYDQDNQLTKIRVNYQTAEQEMMDTEFVQIFENFNDSLSLREQDLLKWLIDEIEKETDDVFHLFSTEIETNGVFYSKEETQNLMLKMKNNPAFQELFLN